MKIYSKALLIPSALILLSCTPAFQGKYEDPDKLEILDEDWNETDAKRTSEVLINSMLQKPWLSNYRGRMGGSKPVVIIKDIENRTNEHIDTKALNEYVQNALINSGAVRFLDGDAREKILAEIEYQSSSGMVASDSQKKKGRQVGADFFLRGAISAQEHSQDGVKTKTYQTNLILTNLETTEIEWSENYRVKKRFTKASASW